MTANLETKVETKGLNLEDPVVKLFRKLELNRLALVTGSDLYHKKCDTRLPYNSITVGQVNDGVDANLNTVVKLAYFCPLCQEYFDKPKSS